MVDTLELFRNHFTSTGSIIIECSCGINHVADDELSSLEKDELTSLEKFEEENPDKVMHYNCTSIEWFNFGGKQIVVMCPCKQDIKIHNLLINNQYQIVNFLKAVLKSEKEEIKYKTERIKGL